MTIRYFADNAAPNAHALAIQGDDAWNGLFPTFQGGSDGPKRNPANFNMDNLQAGDEVLFANGSAWDNGFNLFVENPASSSMARTGMIRFSSYDPGTGATGRPWFKSSSIGWMFNGFGGSGLPTKGGYLIEDIKFEGPVPAGITFPGDSFGMIVNPPLRWVEIRNCEIYGFKVGIAVKQETNCASSYVWIHDNVIHHCGLGAIEGCANWFVVENNEMYANGELGALTHAIYCGSGTVETDAITFRHNHLHDNNIDPVDGVCKGGNLTTRGKQIAVHIDDNRVLNEGGKFNSNSAGIAHKPGYPGIAEYHPNSKVRRNDISGVQSHISLTSVPGVVVQGNRMRDNGTVADGAPAVVGIGMPIQERDAEDVMADSGAQLLDNSFIAPDPRNNTRPVWLGHPTGDGAGAGVVLRGFNIELGVGDGTSYAFQLDTVNTSYAEASDNTLVGGAGWTADDPATVDFESMIVGQGGTASGNVRS